MFFILFSVFLSGRRCRTLFSEEEIAELARCVELYGRDWKMIKKRGQFHSVRTPSDLKDKWRNVQIQAGITRGGYCAAKFRRFRLLNASDQIFTNRFPFQAAMKAATRG